MSILKDKIAAKKRLNYYNNNQSFDKFKKQEGIKKSFDNDVKEGSYDDYDLIVNNYKLYKRLQIIAKALEKYGIVTAISNDRIVFTSNDAKSIDVVQDFIEKFAGDESISEDRLQIEVERVFAEPINNDLNNNGIEDKIEDDRKITLDWEKHVRAYKRDVALDNKRQQENADYARQCAEIRRRNEEERRKEEAAHGRSDQPTIKSLLSD